MGDDLWQQSIQSDEAPRSFATVALSLPFKFHSGGTDGLTYEIPAELQDRALVGSRVLIPLGQREKTGVIVAVTHQAPDIKQKVRAITDVLDSQPVFDEAFLEWTKWIAKYYMSSWGEVLSTALPEGLKPETRARVKIADSVTAYEIDQMRSRAPRRAEILETLRRSPKGLSIELLGKQLKAGSLYAALHALEEEGMLQIEKPLTQKASVKKQAFAFLAPHLSIGSEELSLALSDIERQAPRQANILLALVQQMQLNPEEPLPVPILLKKAGATMSTFTALVKKEMVIVERREVTVAPGRTLPADYTLEDISNVQLTHEQEFAVMRIGEAMVSAIPKTFLIHGITGSGKTEVYISLARRVIESGGGVLILVPEIALTPQLIERFQRRLSITDSGQIAVLHSKMSMTERSGTWRALGRGEIKIAIGARSAVFAPIQNLQLIIVDEEHESSYKQYDKTPRYHARDIAVVRASMLKGVCVLGSATPSVESYYNALEGKYELIKLTQRAKQARLPEVKIVDLRLAENRKDFAKAKSALTPVLRDAMRERIEKHEGIVLFQNRRGFSTYLQCTSCGSSEMCRNCSVTLTYHRPKDQMRCHYCGFYEPKRTTCSTCGADTLRLGGMGTQRVEDDIAKAFPESKVLRMDLDTTAKKGAYKNILTSFANGEADILLGTQMVAKGLDFPRVTLVGVISADTSLSMPDFRAAERTFQLLTQVAGRAGRSLERPGEVLIQTLQPDHPSITMAVMHDYPKFFELELPDRAALMYPPYSRLILIEFRGLNENTVKERAEAFASLFPEHASFYERIGPAPPMIAKLRNEYRYHVLLKDFKKQDPSGEKIRRLITGAIEQYQKRFASQTVKLIVDVDVQSTS